MPRKTKQQIAEERMQEIVSAAIAAYPFAPDRSPSDSHAYETQEADVQRAIVGAIAFDKASGLSGAELRAKYSGPGCPTNAGLSGPLRRKLLRAHDLASPATIARSYVAYSDKQPRAGSAHAKEHGPQAIERQAAALAALAAQEEANAKASAKEAKKGELRAMREALRAAGLPVPRKESELREAHAGLSA